MKLSWQLTGLCSSGAVVITTYTAIFNNMPPFSILSLAVPSGILAGIIGYVMGDILSHPKGSPRGSKSSRTKSKPCKTKPEPKPTHGNQTFLADLEEDGTSPPAG